MNRKRICLTMAALLLFALTLNACGKKAEPETTQPVTEPAATTQAALEELGLTTWSLSASTWSSPNGATIHLTAEPTRHADGDSASFVVRLEDEEIANVPCTWENGNYVAEADLNAADGYCYYVVLTGADGSTAEVAVNTPANPIEENYINMQSALEDPGRVQPDGRQAGDYFRCGHGSGSPDRRRGSGDRLQQGHPGSDPGWPGDRHQGADHGARRHRQEL